MRLVGHKTESAYRQYAIFSESDLLPRSMIRLMNWVARGLW